MQKRVRVLISGGVQGVGFRYWVKRTAWELGISGWVKNLENGGVEAIFEGEEALIEKIINECWQGPPLSRVEKVVVNDEEVEGLKGFEIRRDSVKFATLKK